MNSIVGLATGSMSGVADVLVGFVNHSQTFRCERLHELTRDDLLRGLWGSVRGAHEILSLPMYPELSKEQIAYVAHAVRELAG